MIGILQTKIRSSVNSIQRSISCVFIYYGV